MIPETIQLVSEQTIVIVDVDRLDTSIHGIIVKRLKDKVSNILIIALPGIPVLLDHTVLIV